MKRLLAAALLLALPLAAQEPGAAYRLDNVAVRLDGQAGGINYGTMAAPSGCASGYVPYFDASLKLVCSPTVYAPATDTTTATGTIAARNLTATALTTPVITPPVSNVLSLFTTVTVVAGASLVDGDYFTLSDGSAVVYEFDNDANVTAGRVGITFTGAESAQAIRDLVVVAINGSTLEATAIAAAADTLTVTSDAAGDLMGVNSENVSAAGFLVPVWGEPTHATTYGYKVEACLADGKCAPSAEVQTTTGHAELSNRNYNSVTWGAVTGAASYKLTRVTGTPSGGDAPPRLLYTGPLLTFSDTNATSTSEAVATGNETGAVRATSITLAATNTGAATPSLVMDPLDSSVAHLGVWMGNTDFAGVHDPTMFWGYNYTPQKASHPRFYWGLEGNFNDVPNSHVWAETYIERKDTGGTSYRPFIVGAYDGHAEAAFSTDTVSMLSRTGAGVGQFVNAGANPYFQLNANAYIMALGNNHHFLQQASALIPGAYLDLIGLSAADRVMLGGASVQGVDVASGSVLIGTYLVKDKGGYLTIRNSTDAYDTDFEAGIVNIGGARLAFGTDDYSTVGTATLRPKEIHVTRAVLGSKSKAIVDATPTAFATIPMADGAATGGKLIYRVVATNGGTSRQVVSGSINYAAVRDGATYAVDYDEIQQSTAVTTGTLTGAVTAAGASDLLTFSANFDTDLGTPVLTIYYRFDSTDTLAITPL